MADTQIKMTTTAEVSVYACAPQTVWAMTTLKAPTFENIRRPTLDIVAVIDKSGSMAGTKLELVKKTLETLVAQLRACDRLALVTYDTEVTLDLALSPMDDKGRSKATQVVNGIRDGSSTNLSGGLLEGLNILRNRPTDSRREVSSVLLLTDGLANVGISTTEGIIAAMGAVAAAAAPESSSSSLATTLRRASLSNFFRRKSPTPEQQQQQQKTESDSPVARPPTNLVEGCTVYTFGYGSDADSNMLKAISDAGSGTYYFIENKDTVATSFGDCLGGLVSVCAQNLALELRVPNGCKLRKIHARNPVEFKEENMCAVVRLADLQSEERRDIVVEIDLSEASPSAKQLVLSSSLEYLNVITMKMDKVYETLTVERATKLPSNISKSTEVDVQKCRVVAADAIERAAAKAAAESSEASFAAARAILDAALAIVRASLTPTDPYILGLIKDLERCRTGVESFTAYNSYGGSEMTSRGQSHWAQRSNKAESSMYVSSAKSAMRSLF
ncbi:hypothetical protein CAOG_04556 [Capsaspora owczarzaki ATCC 30864]|uniref:VWFA domain-containing protein n=1 Tax=Capsaspora owczarzaki (strain ATCC 30864) TaxID=595528 RepID=A0A0D2UFC3_CAPO3|nr:hypothetical protein CAOG_04556 [Capsaspora owczarzaki ATCC 30864]KJE93816.1 hypothetical protein CAOG_004556 [Capsaspora owczarzaki ATCC 30864]|eukprot:XP_004347303.1 hypothetical protein CAOG_04556 [Capsaspora owczarzaki ATCC 30864]